MKTHVHKSSAFGGPCTSVNCYEEYVSLSAGDGPCMTSTEWSEV